MKSTSFFRNLQEDQENSMLDPSDFLEIIEDNDSSNQQSFSRKKSPEIQNWAPSKNSVEAHRSYILENSTTHVVDNVKIYVKKPTNVGFKGEIWISFVKSQKYFRNLIRQKFFIFFQDCLFI